ncbi:MAG TPA: hypothetical protein DFS52_13460, partial [Myxococcales bacterium]|nr:hypothetical protein [Myxococcales bacterium]
MGSAPLFVRSLRERLDCPVLGGRAERQRKLIMMRTWIAALVVPSLLLLGCGEDDPKEPVCGNGTVESGEACDDGNAVDGDGCSADCKSTEQCGNGFVDKGEVCDDGN